MNTPAGAAVADAAEGGRSHAPPRTWFALPRLQLATITEQPWCPRAVRDGVADYRQWAVDAGSAYAPAAPVLAAALRRAGTWEVVDLCSGAGGPWPALRPAVAAALGVPASELRARLTDSAPNAAAYARAELASGGAVRGELRPVDARRVPRELRGVRTMFSAFHRFRPADARRVLADAVAGAAGIAVFEATRRGAGALLAAVAAPLVVLAVTPAMRPFRWSRLLWTYAVPAVPLVVLWDGVVACLRSYTPDELAALGERLGARRGGGWTWHAGEARGAGTAVVTYLVGVPGPPPADPPASAGDQPDRGAADAGG